MNHSVFLEILILLAAAVVAVVLFRRIKLPPVLAYLFVGLVVGPYGLGWIADSEDTRFLAEFGVAFLMFTIGLEFSLPQLIAMKNQMLGVGSSQVMITAALAGIVAWWLGMSPEGAFVVGGALALSSTAIVTKQLTEQLELNSRHGHLAVGILLFQDLAVIPFLIVIPTLASTVESSIAGPLAWATIKGVLAFLIMLAAGRWLLRPLFREIARARSAELFMLMVLLFTLTAAGLTYVSGLSLALGAFLAGMMVGETEYRHQVEADIRPFRDVLLGLFFITVGMLLNLGLLPELGHWMLLLAVVIVIGKTLIIVQLARWSGAEPAVALRTGISLAQGGEFGFALLALALGMGLMDETASQIVLGGVLLSMVAAPLLIRYNGRIAKRVFSGSYGASRERITNAIAKASHGLAGHVIICGYGRIGQNIARFLDQEGIEYIALDLEPDRVHQARVAGERVSYGDSTHRSVLKSAGLRRARALVISYDDPVSTTTILMHTRQLRPDMPVLVRTRDDANLEKFQAAGATEVVPETLEASLMLASHLLLLLNVPVARVIRRVRDVRTDRYRMLRGFFHGSEPADDETDGFRERLLAVTLVEGAHAVGRTLAELDLEAKGVLINAVRRGGIRGPQPKPDTRLRSGDVLVLYGIPENLELAEALLLGG